MRTRNLRLLFYRKLALADYMDACELGHELGCQNQKILEADGVIADDTARAAAKAKSTAASGPVKSSSGVATGATATVTSSAGTVHVSQSSKNSAKEDL